MVSARQITLEFGSPATQTVTVWRWNASIIEILAPTSSVSAPTSGDHGESSPSRVTADVGVDGAHKFAVELEWSSGRSAWVGHMKLSDARAPSTRSVRLVAVLRSAGSIEVDPARAPSASSVVVWLPPRVALLAFAVLLYCACVYLGRHLWAAFSSKAVLVFVAPAIVLLKEPLAELWNRIRGRDHGSLWRGLVLLPGWVMGAGAVLACAIPLIVAATRLCLLDVLAPVDFHKRTALPASILSVGDDRYACWWCPTADRLAHEVVDAHWCFSGIGRSTDIRCAPQHDTSGWTEPPRIVVSCGRSVWPELGVADVNFPASEAIAPCLAGDGRGPGGDSVCVDVDETTCARKAAFASLQPGRFCPDAADTDVRLSWPADKAAPAACRSPPEPPELVLTIGGSGDVVRTMKKAVTTDTVPDACTGKCQVAIALRGDPLEYRGTLECVGTGGPWTLRRVSSTGIGALAAVEIREDSLSSHWAPSEDPASSNPPIWVCRGSEESSLSMRVARPGPLHAPIPADLSVTSVVISDATSTTSIELATAGAFDVVISPPPTNDIRWRRVDVLVEGRLFAKSRRDGGGTSAPIALAVPPGVRKLDVRFHDDRTEIGQLDLATLRYTPPPPSPAPTCYSPHGRRGLASPGTGPCVEADDSDRADVCAQSNYSSRRCCATGGSVQMCGAP